MAVLGIPCCSGFSLVVVLGLLTVVASLVKHKLQGMWASVVVPPKHRLDSCGAWAYLLCSMWDRPRPGIQPVSSTLASGFFTTKLPVKPKSQYF